MYFRNNIEKSTIRMNKSNAGLPIERHIEQVMNNGEPIPEEVDLIYTEKNLGVLPEYNIRTDRFDLALDALNVMDKSMEAQRRSALKVVGKDEDPEPTKEVGEA